VRTDPSHLAALDQWLRSYQAEELFLTDFRRHSGLQLRHDLTVAFAAFEATHFAGVTAVDKDPEDYVRAVEQDIEQANDQDEDVRGRPHGSLGIGKLKGL
jgi:hypothetical protein